MQATHLVCRRESIAVSTCYLNLLLLLMLQIFSCLSHVVNLANIDIMDHITKIAAVETATAIWEYDPSLSNNRVLNGSLDVIAAIQTLAIKVCITFIPSSCISKISHQIQSSGQRIEAFDKLQIECGIPNPLKIALHSNVRWGTAYHMLSVSHKLHQVQCFNIALTLSQPTYPPV